jgi:hypothetical protein
LMCRAAHAGLAAPLKRFNSCGFSVGDEEL